MTTAVCNRWSRLPSLDEVRRLQEAIVKCKGKHIQLRRSGPLHRLPAGHCARLRFRIGFLANLAHPFLAEPDIREFWPTLQISQGPSPLLRRWLARQGFVEACPWKWTRSMPVASVPGSRAGRREKVAARLSVEVCYTATYVLQVRFAFTSGRRVRTCACCKTANPDLYHEWT